MSKMSNSNNSLPFVSLLQSMDSVNNATPEMMNASNSFQTPDGSCMPCGRKSAASPKIESKNGENDSTYKDYSQVPAEANELYMIRSSQKSLHDNEKSAMNFPAKLHDMLSREEFADIIVWSPHGRSWRVLKPKLFEQRVLPGYFRHSKYNSFMRQVNGWGFRRISQGPDFNSYYHELFLKGMPHLCRRMRRAPASARANGEVAYDPDFRKMRLICSPKLSVMPNPVPSTVIIMPPRSTPSPPATYTAAPSVHGTMPRPQGNNGGHNVLNQDQLMLLALAQMNANAQQQQATLPPPHPCPTPANPLMGVIAGLMQQQQQFKQQQQQQQQVLHALAVLSGQMRQQQR